MNIKLQHCEGCDKQAYLLVPHHPNGWPSRPSTYAELFGGTRTNTWAGIKCGFTNGVGTWYSRQCAASRGIIW